MKVFLILSLAVSVNIATIDYALGKPPPKRPMNDCELITRYFQNDASIRIKQSVGPFQAPNWEKHTGCTIKASADGYPSNGSPDDKIRDYLVSQGWTYVSDSQADGHCSSSFEMKKSGSRCFVQFECFGSDDESDDKDTPPTGYELTVQCTGH